MHRSQYHKIIGIILLFITLVSCDNKDTKVWKTTENDCLFFGKADNDNIEYQWDGNTIEKVIHGTGNLSSYKDGNLIDNKIVEAYYGAIAKSDINQISSSEQYIGSTDENGFMSGFGVLIKGNDLYIGTFKDSKPNGYLKLYKSSKLYYDGNWNNGQFDGEGTLYKEDGSIKNGTWSYGTLTQTLVDVSLPLGHYKGYVKDGKPDGLGKMDYNDGSSYQGKWKEGLWIGEGLYTSKNDSVYGIWENDKINGDVIYRNESMLFEGTFLDNMPFGIGNLTTNDSTFYSGGWFDGKRDGIGDMIFPNGDKYSGEWSENYFDGYGEYDYTNENAKYRGSWEKGLQNGDGLYISSEYTYDGEWEKGWMDGECILTFKNGDKYEGTIHENIIDGVGCYTYANGNRYEGEFVNGKLNGLGVFQFKEGDRFEGEFYNGKIYGDGTMYLVHNNGTIAITGFWPIDGSFPKEASMLFENGDLYEGTLDNGIPTIGTWISGKDRKAQIEKIENSTIHKANEFYKEHRETINWCLIGSSAVVTAIGLYGGIDTKLIAGNVNVAINIVDAAMAIASAAVDVHENDLLGEDNTEAKKNLGIELSINIGAIFIPKVFQRAKTPIFHATKNVLRSKMAAAAIKNGTNIIIKESALKFIKGKVFGQVISIKITVRNGVREVEKTLYRSKATSKIAIATGRLFTRIKDQTTKSSFITQKFNENPELHNQMKRSVEGSSKNLGDNMKVCGTGKWYKRNQRIKEYLHLPRIQIEPHHIIPCNPRTETGRKARAIWIKYYGNIDDPRNGIWLGRSNEKYGYKALAKGSNHGTNTYEYEEYASNALVNTYKKFEKKYANDPDMMRKLLDETMDNIKKQLYEGKLDIGNAHVVHTPWSIFKEPANIISDAAIETTTQIANLSYQ